MNVWQRHSIVVAPFVVGNVALRRAAEAVRFAYWRRVYGWSIAPGARVHFSVHIPRQLKIALAEGAQISDGVEIMSELCGAELRLGRNSVVARNTILDISGGLYVGDDVTISEQSVVYTHTHGRDPRSAPRYYPLEIGNRVWICTRALILASTRNIGDDVIVGPYEVVRAPVPAGSQPVSRATGSRAST